jgi:hypothetical protein
VSHQVFLYPHRHFDHIPVFIAIGVGGTGKNPEQLFIVPLKSIDSNFISIETLSVFEKKRDSEFFFDLKTNVLN